MSNMNYWNKERSTIGMDDSRATIVKGSTVSLNDKKVSERIEEIRRYEAEKNAMILAGAQAEIEQKNLLQKQVEMYERQIKLQTDNYNKLAEMYSAQVQANEEAKKELKSSKRFNMAMMIISIIAMLAAIAGPIATILVSK